MRKSIRTSEQSILAICDCGRLHLTYGPVTLHFHQEEFLAFTNELSRLAGFVRMIVDCQTPTPIPGQQRSVCH